MLQLPVTSLKGIGNVKAGILKTEAGIETVEDLLYYTPRRYLDRSNIKRIIDCFNDEEVTVFGSIISSKIVRKKRTFLQVDISDGTDILAAVFFGGVAFFQKVLIPGETVVLSGKVSILRNKQIIHPEFDFFDEKQNQIQINTGRIIPLYKSTLELKKHGFDSRGFRRIIHQALEQYAGEIRESLDIDLLEKYNLPNLKQAITGIHFPSSATHAENARKRLAFNEVFFLQYFLLLNKKVLKTNGLKKQTESSVTFYNSFLDKLTFKLTKDQLNAINEIRDDIYSASPMNRLLQGDVGSGKTAVAIGTAMFHLSIGNQVAIMAPTEILAQQHFKSAAKFVPNGISFSLLTGSTPPKEKEKIYEALAGGSISLIIGTHALIQPSVKFKNLGYIIIDEQHRFGVQQRGILRTKGINTDLLVMTATPIPRSLSMTLYGDMDVSYIKEKPASRQNIKTLAYTDERLPGVYNSIRKYIDHGRQVYYVLPLIEESEKLDLKSAVETFNHLKNDIFPDKTIAILHGKMAQKDKDNIMNIFHAGEIDLLVSTTVIEVGIDVPNASIMVIEHAERFGLSQLHQLRGRVGRGEHQSFCILIHRDKLSTDASERINIMTETDDGFIISEKDLKLRGSGQLVGTRQHGATDFEFTDISRDIDIIMTARKEAEVLVSGIDTPSEELQLVNKNGTGKNLYNFRTKRVLQILS